VGLDLLFQPFRIKNLTLHNRVVMAPMTRMFSPGGVPTEEVAAYYRRRAEGQVGLIVTEGTTIDRPAASNDRAIPNLFGDAIPGWKKVVDEVHAAGGLIAPQIWHVGTARGPKPDWEPFGHVDSPSGEVAPGVKKYEAMSDEDIADTLAGFEASARHAREIGFDAVEIHGAHGYLIDQFFWDGLNHREDQWGGETLALRSRFAVEVVKAVRRGLGDDIPLIMRLSQWKQQDYTVQLAKTPDEMSSWLLPMAEAGVDVFHCSQRRFWEPEFEGSDLNFAGWAKKLTGKATITVGSVGLNGEFMASLTQGAGAGSADLTELLRRLEREEFDLVGVGRALLANPDWAVKVKDGRQADLVDFDRKHMAELT